VRGPAATVCQCGFTHLKDVARAWLNRLASPAAKGDCMITFIILAIVAILAIAFSIMAWKSGARKRSGQGELPSDQATAANPKVGRATGPD
jgi:hypothetical protein